MLFPSPSTQRDSLKSKTRDFDLIPEGEFITLCIVPFKGDSDDEVADVRALVILIRAVLTIWLGAIDRSLKPAVKDLVPWGLEYIRYVGLATDNPFATNFIGIERTSKRGKLESTN